MIRERIGTGMTLPHCLGRALAFSMIAMASAVLAEEHPQQPGAAQQEAVSNILAAFKAGNCKSVLDLAGGINLAADDAARADLLQLKGICQKRLGRLKDAEQTYRAAIDELERQGRGETVAYAIALDNLANLYMDQRRLSEAERLRLRALEIFKLRLPPASPDLVIAAQNLAVLYQFAGRNDEARRFYAEALTGAEQAYGADAEQTGIIADNFAGFLRAAGDKAKARELYLRAIAIFEKSLGPQHPDTALALQNYAIFLGEIGETDAAEQLLRRAITINEQLYGPRHATVAAALNTLVLQQIEAKRWPDALATARRAADISADVARAGHDAVPTEGGQRLSPFRRLVQAAYADGAGMADPALAEKAFVAAQRALDSQAADALQQLAERFSGADANLAKLLREAQDLAKEFAARDRALLASVIRPAADRDAAEEARLRQRLAEIAARQTAIAQAIAIQYPQYRALTGGEPLSIASVQRLLRPDEALVQFIDLQAVGGIDETAFVWVVTPNAMRWVRLPLGTAQLAKRVSELRCGLDADAAAGEQCAKLGSVGAGRSNPALHFDTGRAHELYKALFGAVEDMIADHSLLIVTSGALSQLPFQVLTTAPAAAGDLAHAPWLIRKHALTVLPSAASLQALRASPRVTRVDKPYAGFANPLLDGSDAEDARLAALARTKTRCAGSPVRLAAAAPSHRGATRPLRARLADAAFVHALVPLPETADEVCAVAADLGAKQADTYLAERASEATVKAMSAGGNLARYRILHFATHGALAGQVSGSAEPGLILTPPATPTPADDGYLSAPEIAELKLDADLVILSACNTAAGGAEGGEALSGLAKAFFYAGARSLLASHWAVNSAATVKLITNVAKELRDTPAIGRSQAFRRAMLAMIDSGEGFAHPAQWAPFVLVGEGAGDASRATTAPVRAARTSAPAKWTARIGKPQRERPKEADWKERMFEP